jgi:hypothetical protein
MIIFGTRLLGKVDKVPGSFYVATKFFHINFIPLIPIESWIVTWRTGFGLRGKWGGVRIPLDGKSILVAWLRCLLMSGALAGGCLAMIDFCQPVVRDGAAGVVLAIAAAVCLGLVIGSYHAPYIGVASAERARALGIKAGAAGGNLVKIAAQYKQKTGVNVEAAKSTPRRRPAPVEEPIPFDDDPPASATPPPLPAKALPPREYSDEPISLDDLLEEPASSPTPAPVAPVATAPRKTSSTPSPRPVIMPPKKPVAVKTTPVPMNRAASQNPPSPTSARPAQRVTVRVPVTQIGGPGKSAAPTRRASAESTDQREVSSTLASDEPEIGL